MGTILSFSLLALLVTEQPSYLKTLFSANNLPNDLLVIVGMGGIIVALRTLAKIERQTRATEDAAIAGKDAAKAALQQILMMEDKERARLIVNPGNLEIDRSDRLVTKDGKFSVEPIAPGDYFIRAFASVKNIGTSKAYSIDSVGKLAAMRCDEANLPHPDSPWIVVAEDDVIEPGKEPIPIQMSFNSDIEPMPKLAQDIAESRAHIYFYGFIEYETLGVRWHKDFGYQWMPYNPKTSAAKMFTGFSDPRTTEDYLADGLWVQLSSRIGEYKVSYRIDHDRENAN